uniref:F-box domain-containing protein n=1 Tax=Mycena chlorophos TaxID=658473 RepID=A0ABQ0KY42_MYCCL|nr:predicted protein [Mycena chlorophos]
MSELPGELIELIIDFLASDSALPLEYSLISHRWLPRNRHHRFASLHLEVGWDARNQYSLRETEYLLELAASPLATFIPHVRTVAVTHKWDVRVDGPVLSPRGIMSALEECGIRPSTLVLDCLRLFNVPPQEPPPFSDVGCVTCLVVNLQENYAALDGIVHSFCAFPTLEALQVEGSPDKMDDTPPEESDLSVPPLLKSLSTADPGILEWFSGLNKSAFPRELTRLELCGVPSHGFTWSMVNECLQKPPWRRLQALTLRDCRVRHDKSIPDLRHLPFLHHLTIHAALDTTANLLQSLLEVQVKDDQPTTMKTLTNLTLNVGFLSGVSYKRGAWRALDGPLADHTRFPYFQTGCISIQCFDPPSEFLDYSLSVLAAERSVQMPIALVLHEHLGECSARGLLHVDIPIVQPRVLQNGNRGRRRSPSTTSQ